MVDMMKHSNLMVVAVAVTLSCLTISSNCSPFFEAPSSDTTKADTVTGNATTRGSSNGPSGYDASDANEDDYMIINEGEIVQRNDILQLISSANKEELEEMLATNPNLQDTLISKVRTAVQQRQDVAVQQSTTDNQPALYDIGQGQTHVQAPVQQQQVQLDEQSGQQPNRRPYAPSYSQGRPNQQGRPSSGSFNQPSSAYRGNWSEFSETSRYNQNGAYYNPNSGASRPYGPQRLPQMPPQRGSWDQESWRLANIETDATMKAYEKLRKKPSLLFLGKNLKQKWDAHKFKAKMKKDPYGAFAGGYPGGYLGDAGYLGGYPGGSYPGASYPDAGYSGAGYTGTGYSGPGYPGTGYPGSGYQGSVAYPPGYFVGPGYVGSYNDGFVKKSDVSQADGVTAKPANAS